MSGIPFDQISAAALAIAPSLLADWFPQGRRCGREFTVGSIRGEPGESLKFNLNTAVWSDFATGESGADLIDLRAAMIGGNKGDAARELAKILGISVNGADHPYPRKTPPPRRQNEAEWIPMVPPPDGTAPPPQTAFSGFDAYFEYTDLNDRVTHYVGRIEARNGTPKVFIPLTYGALDGVEGWHKRRPANPLALYGLNRLAAFPDAEVIVCEGEKAADAAQTLFPGRPCLSWFGGTGSVEHADLNPLQGRQLIIWPDADHAGRAAAARLTANLPSARAVRVDDLPGKFDAADLITDDPERWLADRLAPKPGEVNPKEAAAEATRRAKDHPKSHANGHDKSAGTSETEPTTWRALDLPSFEGVPVPERRWIVPNWLPVRVVTLCYADGGIGKTLLAMQLMAATALGAEWCGLRVEPCNSIGLFSEDDTTELHIRLDAIREHYGASWADLGNMHPVDATGQDNVLVRVQSDGTMVPTDRFAQLRDQAMDTKATLVVIDTAATCFAGNENDRAQVTGFVGNFLTKLAQDIDGAVLLNAHPSLTGLTSGDLRSGSTAWNNSCRSRWGLARPEGDDGKPVLNSPERILTRRKANAATTGDAITMEWRSGVFTVPQKVTAGTGNRKDQAEAAFLAALAAKRAAGIHVSANSRAGNYAPKVLYNTPEGRDFSKRELIDAMGNLMKRGCLKTQTYKHNYETQEELVMADK